ncbi:hypothetical protein HBI56_026230 [Parastagonospora nodorum]|nr:hypothetical protein HBH47_104780 [Parastagonospora nodorum]KAH4200525.1 hypothetical protein HBI95_170830 [Parastagonospora nodorum]KAH4236232.1 hypothetical protein HBI05_134470 [Parastagonospora nodorum]KAH4242516.1 hypothetical protein HBI06_014390 [Parastagonospora nodorum]KAH4254702.1 hypothetical protein HBI03_182070 [Parastagonospora nodorum]
MLAPQPNGLTTEFPLTANLLDPLVSPHCSLSPPPRYCTQLHLTRHIFPLATLQHLLLQHISPVFKNERPDSDKLDFEARVPIPFSVFPSAYRNAEVKESTSVKVEGEAKVSQQAVHGGEGHEETHESFTATVRQPQPHPHPHPQPQPHPHPQEPAHRDTYVKEEIHITEQERLRRPQPPQHHEEVHIHEQTRYRQPEQPQQVQPPQHQQQHRHEHRQEHVEFQSARDRYQPPSSSTTHTHVEVQDRAYDRHFNTVHGPATDYAPSQIDVTERQFPPTPTTNKPHATRARLSLPRTPIPTKDRLTVSTAATQPRFE